MPVLDEWGLPREYREFLDAPTAVAEILATAVGWPLPFILRKATEAELRAEANVNLNADSCSSASEACACV